MVLLRAGHVCAATYSLMLVKIIARKGTFALTREWIPSKSEHMQTVRREIMSLRMSAPHIVFLRKYLVRKVLAIIIRFFIGFFKIPTLLKISVLRNYICVFFVSFIINPVCWLLNSFEMKSCFQEIKYLAIHYDLSYLWQNRCHPLVRLRRIQQN